VSNLAGCTLSSEGPQCPGHASQVNGSRDGFPPGDEFEGSGHGAEDKPERENPDVNISPSAYEPYKSLKRFKLVDAFADSEINASFGKTVDAFSHEQQKQNRRRVAVGRKPENARQWQFTMTLGIIHRTMLDFPAPRCLHPL